MRRNLHETDDFLAARQIAKKRTSSLAGLMKYPREVLVVVGLTMGGTTAFYTYTTYMQKFLKLSVGLNDNQTTLVTATSLVFALILQPLYGALSDRIGRKPLLIWFGVSGTLFTIPLLLALQATKSAFVAWLLLAGAWLIVAGYTSINAVVKAELFPTKYARPESECPTPSPCRFLAAQPNRSLSGSSPSVTRPGSITT